MFDAYIFDLDGVLVDTAQYHFRGWKRLADELEISFTEEDNEQLKGVSREDSLNYLLQSANREATDTEKATWADKKNQWYLSFIKEMGPNDVLPGARNVLQKLKQSSKRIALGSSSKNAQLVLRLTELTPFFDTIVDGTMITRAKPDPELFSTGAERLKVSASRCVVFEDAAAGIAAAKAAGMFAVAVGKDPSLSDADLQVDDLTFLDLTTPPFNLTTLNS